MHVLRPCPTADLMLLVKTPGELKAREVRNRIPFMLGFFLTSVGRLDGRMAATANTPCWQAH